VWLWGAPEELTKDLTLKAKTKAKDNNTDVHVLFVVCTVDR